MRDRPDIFRIRERQLANGTMIGLVVLGTPLLAVWIVVLGLPAVLTSLIGLSVAATLIAIVFICSVLRNRESSIRIDDQGVLISDFDGKEQFIAGDRITLVFHEQNIGSHTPLACWGFESSDGQKFVLSNSYGFPFTKVLKSVQRRFPHVQSVRRTYREGVIAGPCDEQIIA